MSIDRTPCAPTSVLRSPPSPWRSSARPGCTSAEPGAGGPTPTPLPATSAPPGAAGPASTASVSSASAPPATSAAPSEAADVLTIDITIAGGKVTPNGRKVDAEVGQKVVLNVTSDADDEIHAHADDDGYELEGAGRPEGHRILHPHQPG